MLNERGIIQKAMKMMKYYDKAASIAWKILAYILAFTLLALVVVVFWQIICRFLLKTSTLWQSEISTLLFIWATYLGVALAIRSGDQICMTLILNKTKSPVREIIQMIAALICEIFYGVIAAAGFAAVHKFSGVTTTGLGLPMPVVYYAFVVSGIIMIFFGLEEILRPLLSLTGRSVSDEE